VQLFGLIRIFQKYTLIIWRKFLELGHVKIVIFLKPHVDFQTTQTYSTNPDGKILKLTAQALARECCNSFLLSELLKY